MILNTVTGTFSEDVAASQMQDFIYKSRAFSNYRRISMFCDEKEGGSAYNQSMLELTDIQERYFILPPEI